MVIFNNLLLGVTRFSIEAQETLENILELPEVNFKTDINGYIRLIDNMVTHTSLIVKVHYLEVGEDEMKKYIRNVFLYAAKLMELDYKLSREEGNEELIAKLSKLSEIMRNIREKLSNLAWEVLRVYGPKEAMLIVSPGYIVLSGIWIEYRRSVLPMEA
ncbi:hypothetical protein [Clostridium thermarum]|uniref:hypothetical protein n=1 Tax=Clostridium thermarum TaxID=1716543 RepID=UPI0013D4998E|nr:hypothetical protein [Clostridium thermarum]